MSRMFVTFSFFSVIIQGLPSKQTKRKSCKFLTGLFKNFLHPVEAPASNKIGMKVALT